ncbi:hypothetical protein C8R34_105118 [Nitrosomonas sp. Nm84]|uniref:hypothetical protein n=1 Tax=Nitrosomonas sp. Nm84 TaxID=200124 RepID=UPI000D76A849|nr:hypothetical protein [Nitrosomonas sp. Nm84]PXW89137.1 hypothetical protein C8R34_105118 [Nitrosomonas sp. Nm84]
MEISNLLFWAVGAIALAGFIDWKIINWIVGKVTDNLRNKVHCERLIFEPGDKLKSAELD